MRTAIAYVRLSPAEGRRDEAQAMELLYGPEAQRTAIRAFAEREGIEILEWVEELVSGGTPLVKRPKLIAALSQVGALGCQHLLVAKRDRLARETLTALLVEQSLENVQATSLSADGLGNGDDPAQALLRGIINAVAEFERRMIGARTKAALAAAKTRGVRLGGRFDEGFDVTRARQLYASTRSYKAVARAVGCCDKKVRRHLERSRP